MSYILDALKRADAERERGHVPGLHSQSASVVAFTPTGARRAPAHPAVLAGLAALLLAAAVAVWWWPSAREGRPGTITTAAMPATPLPSEAAPAAAAEPPVPALPILAPPSTEAPAPAAPAHPTTGAADTRADKSPPGAAAAGTPAPPTTTPETRVRSLAELPPEIRAQLPQVSISGSTHSSNPAHRMLIANGKVVREGEDIAPGLRVETIGPNQAVLNHGGARYSVGF